MTVNTIWEKIGKVSSVETKDFTPGKNIELSYADIKITNPSIKDADGNAYELKDSDYEILKYTYSGNNKNRNRNSNASRNRRLFRNPESNFQD